MYHARAQPTRRVARAGGKPWHRIRDVGETHLSDPFDINRGSVQGELCSARVFIARVSRITREADTHPTFIDLDTEIRLQCLEL